MARVLAKEPAATSVTRPSLSVAIGGSGESYISPSVDESYVSDDRSYILSSSVDEPPIRLSMDEEGTSDLENPVMEEPAAMNHFATSPISISNETRFVTTRLSIQYPNGPLSEGLYQSLWNSAESFYSLLDKLPLSAFALGLDILPDDIPLAESNDEEYFSGKPSLNN